MGVIGVNHKVADLKERERLASILASRLSAFSFPFVSLSTCNRIEVYFEGERFCDAHERLVSLFEEESTSYYCYFNLPCFLHLAKVTAGMDSALVGETEIQGQVRLSYLTALEARPLSSDLHFLFQKALKIGKEVRSLATFTPSLGEIIVEIATTIRGNIQHKRVLFVGSSEINHAVYASFQKKGIADITFCSRSEANLPPATKLLSWTSRSLLMTYEIIVCGTKHDGYLIDNQCVTEKPLLIFDLAVPRNVDPAISRVPTISLFNIDEINTWGSRQRVEELLYVQRERIEEAVSKQLLIWQCKRSFVQPHLYAAMLP